jgi:O-antigen/teichoic acid export membrane protein
MDIYRQIFKNTMAGWFEMLMLVISGFIITPILIGYFGKEGYGVWMLIGSVVGYFAILDLGVSSSLSRFIAKYNARKDADGLSRILTVSLFLYSISAFIIIILTFIVWPRFSDFFNLTEKYRQVGSWLILIMGSGVAISLPLRVGQGIFQGIHRFDLMYLLRSLGVLFRISLIVIFFSLLSTGNLALLACINISVSLIPNIIMCFLAKRYLPKISYKKKYLSWLSVREIWSLSLSAVVISFSAILFRQTQVLAVGKIVGVEIVALYVIPLMLMGHSSMLVSYIIAAFTPLASEMDTLNRKQELQNLNIQGVKISFVISLGLLVLVAFYGKSFLLIWLQSKTLQESDFIVLANLLLIMAIGFCVGSPQTVTNKMFVGSGKQWFVAKISILNTLISLTVGYLLLRYSSLGLYGMGIGWSLFYVISGIIVYPLAVCRAYNIDIVSYFIKAYSPPIMATLPFLIGAYLIKRILHPTSLLPLGISIFFCLLVYVTAAYYICLNQKQRIQIWART